MRKSYIVAGILVFLLMITAPAWLNIGKSADIAEPAVSLDTPEIQALGADAKCIYDAEYMRTHHMEVLAQWKKQAMRNNNRSLVLDDGREIQVSLQESCLKCHSNYEEFCKKCHDYNGVDPNCWNCHVNPSAENGGALKEGIKVGGDV